MSWLASPFCFNVSYASLFAMKLEKLFLTGKSTTLCQTKMSCSQALYQTLETTKTNFEKLLRKQVFKKLKFQSVLIFFKFVHPPPRYVFAVLFSFNVLSGYFYVSLNLVAVPAHV